jgi:AMP-binding enzyme/Phosphopantetheine attachment site
VTITPTRTPDPTRQDTRTTPDAAPVRFDLLRSDGTAALVQDGRTVSHAELADLVEQRRRELGPVRRLVVLDGASTVEAVVDHLACLAGGHVAILVAPGAPSTERLVAAYDPDVVVRHGQGRETEIRRDGSAHELHPDLALLMSTSGSSGSPKLVRISTDNLRANASAIADYLGLDDDDCAATSLPLHYCYGLSVLHSHLLVGGSVWLTDESVVDDAFWDGFVEVGATSLAGVPHSFELLEQSDFFGRRLPRLDRLRRITQAGGALPAPKVAEWAGRGRVHGFDLFVMYGATEATARMAYLPPHLAHARPETIGIPVPGGDLRIDDGELVYSGPNVMLGYATCPADLALGRTVHELHTGDLAIQHDDGLFQIVGRRSRTAKLFGLRIDLDHVERLLRDAGVDSRAVEGDGTLTTFLRHGRAADKARRILGKELCLPPHALAFPIVAEFPLTTSGKTDYPALVRHTSGTGADDGGIRAIYAALLGRPDARDDESFVQLGGDSLSFVEVSVRLERRLGRLPANWQELSIAELEALEPRPRRWTAQLDTAVALRAIGIVLVVGSHTEWFTLQGGAHLLLGLVGFNLARFQLAPGTPGERRTRLRRSFRDLLVPSLLWIGAVAIISGKYAWSTVTLSTNLVGPSYWTEQWQVWFLEAAAWSMLALMAALAVPWVRAQESAQPWRFGLIWLGLAMALRFALTGVEAVSIERYSATMVAWCVPLGYLVARSDTSTRRLVMTGLIPLCTFGFFDEPVREAVIVAGLLLVLWAPRLVLPRGLPALLSPLASASLAIYLTHWVVYPPLDADHDVLAALLSLAVGVAVWKVAVFAVARMRALSVAVPGLRGLVPTRPEVLRAVSPTRRRSSRPRRRQGGPGQPCEAP